MPIYFDSEPKRMSPSLLHHFYDPIAIIDIRHLVMAKKHFAMTLRLYGVYSPLFFLVFIILWCFGTKRRQRIELHTSLDRVKKFFILSLLICELFVYVNVFRFLFFSLSTTDSHHLVGIGAHYKLYCTYILYTTNTITISKKSLVRCIL